MYLLKTENAEGWDGVKPAVEEALPKDLDAVVASARVGLAWAQTLRGSIAEKRRG
jgi:hypothetical protein